MKRTTVLLSVLLLALGMMGGSALANGQDGLPEHPHVKLLHVELTEDGATYERCVDLAGNKALPLNAHHEAVHFGTAGQMLFEKAGHAIVPMAPFPGIPWTGCDDLPDVLPPPPE